MPINSGSRKRGCGCAFGNLTVSPSPERSTAAGSAHPLIVTNDGSGHSNTSPRVCTHHTNWKGEFSTALQGIVLLQKNVSKSQHEPLHPRLFSKHGSVIESAIWSLSGEKALHRHQMSAFSGSEEDRPPFEPPHTLF